MRNDFIDWNANNRSWDSLEFLSDEELMALGLPFLNNPEKYPHYVLAIPQQEKETQETIHG